MRERLGAIGAPMPAGPTSAARGPARPSAMRRAGPSCSRRCRAATTARACGSSRSPRRSCRRRSRRRAVFVEQKVRLRTVSWRPMVGRSPRGETVAWPVVETVQINGVCTEVLAPAPGLDPRLAAEAQTIATASPRTSASSAHGGRAVRGRGPASGQRAGDAPAQLGSLVHRGGATPRSSSSICAPCWAGHSGDPRPARRPRWPTFSAARGPTRPTCRGDCPGCWRWTPVRTYNLWQGRAARSQDRPHLRRRR